MDKMYPTGPVQNLMKQMSKLQHFKEQKADLFDTLTQRELEVLELIAEGMGNPAIAEKLNITRATVQNHRSHLRSKLDINNQTEYIKYAVAYDLIQL